MKFEDDDDIDKESKRIKNKNMNKPLAKSE
jgi:hypothetical protein